jgi:hypothetical protein
MKNKINKPEPTIEEVECLQALANALCKDRRKKVTVKDCQLLLMKLIKAEVSKVRKRGEGKNGGSGYYNSVWFSPFQGAFLYADAWLEEIYIRKLIDTKQLVYKGIAEHQGQKMLRYSIPVKSDLTVRKAFGLDY